MKLQAPIGAVNTEPGAIDPSVVCISTLSTPPGSEAITPISVGNPGTLIHALDSVLSSSDRKIFPPRPWETITVIVGGVISDGGRVVMHPDKDKEI